MSPNPRLFDPGPKNELGEEFFHFGSDPALDRSRTGSFHAGTHRAAEDLAQQRFHSGAIHHLRLRPDVPRYNTPDTPTGDDWANAVGNSDPDIAEAYAQNLVVDPNKLRREHGGKAIYYTNEGEDVGSTSVVAPSNAAFDYLGSEAHVPVQVKEDEYHQRTDIARPQDAEGWMQPSQKNLQPRLFGLKWGNPSPYVRGMPEGGHPAGERR